MDVSGKVILRDKLNISTVSALHECFDSCVKHPDCKSINYQEEAFNNCELTGFLKETVLPSEFIARQGWTYYATNYSIDKVSIYMSAFSSFSHYAN